MTRVCALAYVLPLSALVCLAFPARAETFRLTPENTSITFVSRWDLVRPEGRVRGDFGVDIFRFIAGDEIDPRIESALTLTAP